MRHGFTVGPLLRTLMCVSARAHDTSLRIYHVRLFTISRIPGIPIVFYMRQRLYCQDLTADIDVHICPRTWHKHAHIQARGRLLRTLLCTLARTHGICLHIYMHAQLGDVACARTPDFFMMRQRPYRRNLLR